MKTTTTHTDRTFGPSALLAWEKRLEHFLIEDWHRTGQDVARLERAMRTAEKRHPYAATVLEGMLFVAALIAMLAWQAWHAAGHF
jgi:hypothetical protein